MRWRSWCIFFIFFSCLINIPLVSASTVGLCSIPSIILDCELPPNSHTDWLASRTTIVRKGMVTTNDSNFALIENENLQINITSDAYLRNYWCETSPPSDDVREFPLQELNLHCCQEQLLKDNSHAVVEMRTGLDLIYFNKTSCGGTLLISPARKVSQHLDGSPHCDISLTECVTNPRKSKAQAVKPGIRWTIIISCVVVLLHIICG